MNTETFCAVIIEVRRQMTEDGIDQNTVDHITRTATKWHEQYLKHMADVLGVTSDDLLVKAIHLQGRILFDPVIWVNQQIARYVLRES